MKFTLAISVLKSQITLKIFYLETIIEIQIVCILTEKATRLTRLPFVILVKLGSLDPLLLLLSRFSCVRLCATPWSTAAHRLPRPWDSPGKNTGVGCHFLLQCMKVKSESEVGQSRPTFHNPMDYTAYQAPPSMGFSRQEYWSGLPLPSPTFGSDLDILF